MILAQFRQYDPQLLLHYIAVLLSFALRFFFFFFNDTATTEIYTLSLHDALPIYPRLSIREIRKAGARRSRPLRLRADERRTRCCLPAPSLRGNRYTGVPVLS